MKKTINKAKLVLNQETVRTLSAGDLRDVAGGNGPCSRAGSGCFATVGLSVDCNMLTDPPSVTCVAG